MTTGPETTRTTGDPRGTDETERNRLGDEVPDLSVQFDHSGDVLTAIHRGGDALTADNTDRLALDPPSSVDREDVVWEDGTEGLNVPIDSGTEFRSGDGLLTVEDPSPGTYKLVWELDERVVIVGQRDL